MTLSFALPVRLDAPLGWIDPRWKLAALVLAGIAIGLLHTLGPASVALCGTLAIVALARLPLRWFMTRIGALILFLAAFLLLVPVVNGDENEKRWLIGPVSLSPHGCMVAGVLLCKAVALMSLLLAAVTTAPLNVQLKALHSLRVPGLMVRLVALTARYLAVVLSEFGRMRTALRVRGFRQRASLRSLRTVGHVSGMLLVRASDRAECISQALRCRGFDGRFRALAEFHARTVDLAFFVVVTGAAATLVIWDMSQG